MKGLVLECHAMLYATNRASIYFTYGLQLCSLATYVPFRRWALRKTRPARQPAGDDEEF
jgi:hypothetical protein